MPVILNSFAGSVPINYTVLHTQVVMYCGAAPTGRYANAVCDGDFNESSLLSSYHLAHVRYVGCSADTDSFRQLSGTWSAIPKILTNIQEGFEQITCGFWYVGSPMLVECV